jgi:hypothetical protein
MAAAGLAEKRGEGSQGEDFGRKEEALLNLVIRTLDTKEFRLQVVLLRDGLQCLPRRPAPHGTAGRRWWMLACCIGCRSDGLGGR